MEISILVLLLVFFSLLLLNVPISFCIGLATLATMLISIDFMPAVTTMAQRMAGGINSFALLAIPFFILSGLIMGRGGIAKRLIECAMALIGMLPGGLALVNVVSCMFFGAISGSAVAATSAIGSFMLPEMKKQGYDVNFSAAVTASAATTGMLIPPSNILIVYAIASGGVSIAALFVAGYLPGILLGVSLMLVCAGYAKLKGYPVGARLPLKLVAQKVAAALPSLFMIFLVIGGIIGGIFTATEAGAIAVIYSLILAVGLYREVKVSELSGILMKAAETTAIVLALIATSSAMSWILSYEQIPQTISAAMLTISENPLLILLMINLILLIVGAFMDMTPAVLIFTPIFLPVAVELGMSPLHFGIMMVLNLSIGLVSPPVGSVLFVSCAIAKTRIEAIIRPMLPLYLAMFVVLMLVTYIPAISEFLPALFGL
ncbi:TRAP transporter DctM-like subunit [Alishewanella agri BL06]|jgi:tripartite ATP-independent transporter DctM subunit|uniref:TRAP transporter large permease protein n=1 Tax=Alishewanella agri BL06 TaxID=1195246 RepID=I9NZF3_9ALTE|nr:MULTISPECIES: TRAP transporter large permease [Alishewanella]EIW87834.1 TRAP transporter DctM-like subunit [Alishewanella agri BL06]MCT8124459.1 TRAP transporter large permease [Alishewanella sp. BS5-314]